MIPAGLAPPCQALFVERQIVLCHSLQRKLLKIKAPRRFSKCRQAIAGEKVNYCPR